MTIRKIAVEEAFMTPELGCEWKKALAAADVEPGFVKMGESVLADTPGNASLHAKLLDIGAGRIARMDEIGLDMQVLSITSPGVQVFAADVAVELAAHANDELAAAVRAHPERFAGLGAIAPQDPPAAAREIERIRNLGLSGLIVNSHTHGEYLDLPKFRPIFEAMETTRLPMYLHPREPAPQMVGPYLDYGLYFAGWGFAAETGLHAMRIIMSGLLDDYPNVRIVLGHMGEGIPFWLRRIDNRYQLQLKMEAAPRLPRLPSEYFRDQFVITTAGVTSESALALSIAELGPERILFAADYPYEDEAEAMASLDRADIPEGVREMIYSINAIRVFNLIG